MRKMPKVGNFSIDKNTQLDTAWRGIWSHFYGVSNTSGCLYKHERHRFVNGGECRREGSMAVHDRSDVLALPVKHRVHWRFTSWTPPALDDFVIFADYNDVLRGHCGVVHGGRRDHNESRITV